MEWQMEQAAVNMETSRRLADLSLAVESEEARRAEIQDLWMHALDEARREAAQATESAIRMAAEETVTLQREQEELERRCKIEVGAEVAMMRAALTTEAMVLRREAATAGETFRSAVADALEELQRGDEAVRAEAHDVAEKLRKALENVRDEARVALQQQRAEIDAKIAKVAKVSSGGTSPENHPAP